jgi:hypothetical protein
MKKAHLYETIWKNAMPQIITYLKQFKGTIQLSPDNFREVGSRKDYTFNLVLNNGTIENNVAGSAVARDLARTIISNIEANNIIKTKLFKIRMDKKFILYIN